MGSKKVSLEKNLNIHVLDIVNTAIEKLMTILVPRRLFKRILDNFKYFFFIFILFGNFVENKKKKKLESKRFFE